MGEVICIEVGKTYLFQGIKDWVGRVAEITGPYTVTLVDASWVADSGRLSDFVKNGVRRADGGWLPEHVEIEPVGVVGVRWENWIPWDHQLPTETI